MDDTHHRGLNPYGPHSPEYTRHVADTMAEAVRVLCYATQFSEGLKYAADVYDVLGALVATAGGLEQITRQLADFLATQNAQGVLALDHGGDVSAAITEALNALKSARKDILLMTASLQTAQNMIGPVHNID